MVALGADAHGLPEAEKTPELKMTENLGEFYTGVRADRHD